MSAKRLIIVLFTLIFSLTGCNESSDSTTSNTGPGADSGTTGGNPGTDSVDTPPTDTPPVSGTFSLSGQVDSHYIDRNESNAVYLFSGTVKPDDIDGDSGDPVAVAQVQQIPGTCTWNYDFSNLEAGEYTLAFTDAASTDNVSTDEVLMFVKTLNFSITDSDLQQNINVENILRVGPGRTYTTLAQAAGVAMSGDVIEIDAGTYIDDIAVWRQNNITLRGVGGRAHLQANSLIPFDGSDRGNGKGIWVITGANVQVENMEFSGASVSDQNGAGIRAESSGDLTICNSYFHDNEDGILGQANDTLLIEFSEFEHNGLGEYGQTHNIYVGGGQRFILRYSYSHHAYIGHNVKSRAEENYILYNRIMDETTGRSSYDIDISNGGLTYIIGNLLHQGVGTDNETLVSIGAEGLRAARTNHIYIINNTFVNDVGVGTFVYINPGSEMIPVTAKVINNLFIGSGTLTSSGGVAETSNNLATTNADLMNIDNYNYRLLSSSPARNAGIEPGIGDGYDLTPVLQYLHPHSHEQRPHDGTIDIGAYEYAP